MLVMCHGQHTSHSRHLGFLRDMLERRCSWVFALSQRFRGPLDIHLYDPGEVGAFSLDLSVAQEECASRLTTTQIIAQRPDLDQADCPCCHARLLLSGWLSTRRFQEIVLTDAAVAIQER